MTDGMEVVGARLAETLDRLIDMASGGAEPSFHDLALAAGLDAARDFIGASLRDLDFRDEDLRGFDFSEADLTGADFRRATITGVSFAGADVTGAIFSPAKPDWADDAGSDQYGDWASFAVPGTEIRQRMRWIPSGRFMMGSPEDEEGRWYAEGPVHEVTIAPGFWLFDTPCTQALWQAVMGENPSGFKAPKRPVEQVSFEDVETFQWRLNQLRPGLNLRLPSEALWEYACRAGTPGARYGDLDAIAWYDGNAVGETHDVALKQANSWGLYDMLGNVFEWCEDHWHDSYRDAPTDGSSWIGRGSANRVIRGGSWFGDARGARAAYRFNSDPSRRNGILGFRCARVQA